MSCEFDEIIDRCHTDSAKWCRYEDDVLPLWVADMDFPAPDLVVQALRERVAHGIFGYGRCPDGLCEVVQERLSRLYGWQVEEEDVLVAIEEAETEEVTDPVAVEGDGGVPIEVLEGVGLLEAGSVEAGGEVLGLSAIDLVLEGEFEEVQGAERGFGGIGGPVRQRGDYARELQALEDGPKTLFDFGHRWSPWLEGE